MHVSVLCSQKRKTRHESDILQLKRRKQLLHVRKFLGEPKSAQVGRGWKASLLYLALFIKLSLHCDIVLAFLSSLRFIVIGFRTNYESVTRDTA